MQAKIDHKKKVVLALSGHDPSGAAGIQADIESITATGCQCVSIITALTIQNTATFLESIPQDPDNFKKQCEVLLSDIDIDSCKIGLLGDLSIAKVISNIIDDFRNIPIVLDPIINAGVGKSLANDELIEFIKNDLLKKIFILTPNRSEARELSAIDDIYKAGEKLVGSGCPYVLITGADEDTPQVRNILFSEDNNPIAYEWERLPGTYHGSGCTLSSTIAAYLAKEMEVNEAIEEAQKYTWETLKHGIQVGQNQIHPNRFYKD